jgi:ubiquinone biosynthesis protein
MFCWDTLIDERALAELLPTAHAHLAAPVRDALVVFLSNLPQSRQVEIVAAQAALPPTASLSQRLGRLAQCCPVLHKLGQILARDERLALSLREQLQQLESMPSSIPLDEIEASLVDELGSLAVRGISLLPPAIAEASVGVVIPFERADLRGTRARQGVFKLLKPQIEERMGQELELLEQVGTHLDERCQDLKIPALDYREAFAQVREKLQFEIRLTDEQRHLGQARKTYADDRRVLIPAIFAEHCSPRLTAMERAFGQKISDHKLAGGRERRKLAELVTESLIAEPIFSRASKAVFHADPHAGNLMLTVDNRLAILDWSLVGTLSQNVRVALVQLLLGAVTLNASRMVSILEHLGDRRRVDLEALRVVVESWLKRVRRGEFPGLQWLTGMLDDAVQHARLRLASDLLMFRKSLHSLDGVIRAIGVKSFNIDEFLLREFALHFAVEWPSRWLSLPHSRNYATRVSNLDLWRTVLSGPATVARFWCGHAQDIYQSAVGGERSSV